MTLCKVEGCNKRAYCKKLCTTHYKRQWRHGDVETVITPKSFERQECAVEGCTSLTYASNSEYCQIHWQRMYRYGRLENVKRDYGTGTEYISAKGYRMIRIGGTLTYEHIYLAEKAVGHKLPENAIVHHVNNKPADNYTRFNLVVCPDQAYHLLLHRRAKELGYYQD